MLSTLFVALVVVTLPAANLVAASQVPVSSALDIDPSGARSGLGRRLSARLPLLPTRPTRAASPASSSDSGGGGFQLIAVGWDTGSIYDVNLTTAALSNERPTGIPLPSGLSVSPTGVLYASRAVVGADPTIDPGLYRIDDPALGTATALGPAGLEILIEGDLDFDPLSGRLYGLWGADLGSVTLFEYDPPTGATTPVGDLALGPGGFDATAIAFDASGVMYVYAEGCFGDSDQIHVVDPATASVLSTVPLRSSISAAVGGMDFDPVTGVLYFASGIPDACEAGAVPALYQIDPVTGDVIEIGPLAADISGLVFLPVP